MTNTGRLAAGVLFVALCTVGAALYSCSAGVDMLFLQWSRKEPTNAASYAARLMQSPAGVRLAIRDIDVFGGSTRGWTSWVVEYNTVCSETDELLAHVAADETESLPRRLEAHWILWRRTGEPGHLASLFDAVRKPGPPAVQIVRQRLADAVRSLDLHRRLEVPASQPIDLTLKELVDAIDRPRAHPP